VERMGPEELHKQEELQDIQQAEGRSQLVGLHRQPCSGRRGLAAGIAAVEAAAEGMLLLVAAVVAAL